MNKSTTMIVSFTALALLVFLIGLLVLLIGFNFNPLTPWGGTRLAVFFSGYPINAIFTGLEYHDYMDEQYYLLSFPPYSFETGSSLFQWNIEKFGIFYWAEFGVA